MKKNILVFPASTEIANEVIASLKNNKNYTLLLASSEKVGLCNFRNMPVFSLPFVTANHFYDELQKLIKEQNIDFIIPAHDDVAYKLSALENSLEKAKVIGQSFFVNNIVRYKDKTYEYFKDLLPIADIFEQIPSDEDFPVFVKPKKGQGSFNSVRLNNIDEFNSFFMVNEKDEYIVMECLTGDEFSIDCFSDNGKLLYAGARSREKATKGISVLSTLVEDKSLISDFENYAKIISEKLNLNGLWFFQMKFSHKNELKLLEIGPRVSGTMMLNRVKGINFIELSLYQKEGFDVEVITNDMSVSLARSLVPIYKHNVEYDNLYIDFDDTLFLDEEKINTDVVKLIFEAKNDHKNVYLLTKNIKNNLATTLNKFGISSIFDEIIHIDPKDNKINYMKECSVLIDDSFAERKNAIKAGHYAFSNDNLQVLFKTA